MKKAISAFLIHHNSIEREPYRNKLISLLKDLNIELESISKQKNSYNKKYNFKMKIDLLYSAIKIQIFNIYHKRYLLKEKILLFFSELINPFIIKIIKILINYKKNNINIYTHNRIEKIVRAKHLKAWKIFLETNNEFLIIFEDDAICDSDSSNRLKNLLNKIDYKENKYIYIDLAGGYKLNQILDKKQAKSNSDIFDLLIKKIWTNTACCYILSRAIVKEFLEIESEDNFSRNFPIDHLLNYLGHKTRKEIYSAHFFKPIFSHGSFRNNIKSWQD